VHCYDNIPGVQVGAGGYPVNLAACESFMLPPLISHRPPRVLQAAELLVEAMSKPPAASESSEHWGER